MGGDIESDVFEGSTYPRGGPNVRLSRTGDTVTGGVHATHGWLCLQRRKGRGDGAEAERAEASAWVSSCS